MGALINETHFKGALIGRRALNRITVLEAVLTGRQPPENIQCWVQFFSFLPNKISQENCGQMSGKSKASDGTNLGTVRPPLIVSTILSTAVYENYPTLDSHDTGPFTRQDGFQNRHKVYSAAYE